ncbi:MAG: hypothetical protein ABI599_04945 [Flavobacteriales bacterium]
MPTALRISMVSRKRAFLPTLLVLASLAGAYWALRIDAPNDGAAVKFAMLLDAATLLVLGLMAWRIFERRLR